MMSMKVSQKQNKKFKTGLIELYSSQKKRHPAAPPNHVTCSLYFRHNANNRYSSRYAPEFMRKTCLLVSPRIADLTDGKTNIQVNNPNEHTLTLEA